MIPTNAALLVIDVQQGLDDPKYGKRNNRDAEFNIARLLDLWRALGKHVLHVQHLSTSPDSPLRPDLPGCEFKIEAMPKGLEPVFRKQVNNAFIGTDLHAYLNEHQIGALVVAGLTTNHCVSSTVRMACDLGFDTYVVADATAAHELVSHNGRSFSADDVHEISLANLHGEFATVITTEQALSAPPAANPAV